MSRLTKLSKILAMNGLLLSSLCFANAIKTADDYFSQQNYLQAFDSYLDAAHAQEPRAYYQLGVMHYKGLGVKADQVKALVWFTMAAKNNYANSADIVKSLLGNVEAEEKTQINKLILSSISKLDKELLFRTYRPVVNKSLLTNPVTFAGVDSLDDVELITDLGFDGALSPFANNFDPVTESVSTGSEVEDFFVMEPYFLIVEYDVARDGSIRNITEIKASGDVRSAVYDLSLNSMAKPSFADQPSSFVHRSFMGIAGYSRLRIRNEFEMFYTRTRLQNNKFKDSADPQQQYVYAMTLASFPWLVKDNKEIDENLAKAAHNGFPAAQYEYGFRQYSQQTNVEQGIDWIYQAAQQDHSQAQYRLGKMFLNSPWLEQDKDKATFWLQLAAGKGHLPAKLNLAEIRLLSAEEHLFDVAKAQDLLVQLKETHENYPQYHYLQAMAFLKMEPRQLSKTVDFLRSAIDRGNELNWDVSAWQRELDSWTSTGTVTIVE
ncbi:tetratricopeptide repeat protein [Thalassotalea sp. HSM 43]|uniref:tetratricopeptide repeat protein n=1 Tax=Thalassotalea sp. HSM 43 TaxID=2552945 RepID=UPI0016736EA5|nr:SEL1-like repeat protein [Thalassotalea sp. HSM 43]